VDRHASRAHPGGDRGEAAGTPRASLPRGARGLPDARGPGRGAGAESAAGVDGAPGGQGQTRRSRRTGRLPDPQATGRPVPAEARGSDRDPRRRRPAAGDLLRVQSRRMRPQRRVGDAERHPAHHLRRGGAHPRVRRDAGGVDVARGPADARLLRVPRGAGGGDRGAPRRHAPAVQGDRGGAVQGRPGEDRVRHRDLVARYQHAGADRGDRGPVEVFRRTARVADAGRVHAAHRASRPQGHRRDRPRRRAVPEAGGVRAGGLARHHADLRAPQLIPARLQHGRQPRAELLAGGGAPPAELVVRAVPRGPRRRRPGAPVGTRQGLPQRISGTSRSTGIFGSGLGTSGSAHSAATNGRAWTRSAAG